MTRRLLDLFGKILKEIRRMESENNEADKSLTIKKKEDIDIITKMYRWQKKHLQSKDCHESIKDRIVSINKSSATEGYDLVFTYHGSIQKTIYKYSPTV